MKLALVQVVAVTLLELAVFEVAVSQESETGCVATTKKTLKKLLAGEITKALDDFTCSVPTTAPCTDPAPSLTRIEDTVDRIEDKLDAPSTDFPPPSLTRIGETVKRLEEKLDALSTDPAPSLTRIENTVEGLADKLNAPNTTPPPPSLSQIEETVADILNQTLTAVITEKLDSISKKIDSLQMQMNNLHWLGTSKSNAAVSCAEILNHHRNSPSGYYWVRNATRHPHRVYCDMTRSCGGVTGGWKRVAYLDMTNSNHQCPSGLKQRIDSGVRTCAPYLDSTGTCSSVPYSSSGIHYTKVCGRIHAYHEKSMDAFRRVLAPTSPITIDSNYVDGISLTRGRNPRHHIWTFAMNTFCPCDASIPAFINNDYFCDAGQYNVGIELHNLHWDGVNCGSYTCCTINDPPWFYQQLPQPTTDDIEMRVCSETKIAMMKTLPLNS